MQKNHKSKFLFLIFGMIACLSFGFKSSFVLAEKCPDGTVFCGKPMEEVLEEDVAGKVEGISETGNLILLVMGWISFALPYAGLLAFVGVLYAGFLYVTGFAEEGNIEKAKKILMWSIVGLILIFSAYVIVATFINPTGS